MEPEYDLKERLLRAVAKQWLRPNTLLGSTERIPSISTESVLILAILKRGRY